MSEERETSVPRNGRINDPRFSFHLLSLFQLINLKFKNRNIQFEIHPTRFLFNMTYFISYKYLYISRDFIIPYKF